MPAPVPNFHFRIDTRNIEKIGWDFKNAGGLYAYIYNTAKSKDGYYYWFAVNDGRGWVFPIRARCLHWIDPKTGRDVFAMWSRPSAPRHIRERAIPIIVDKAQRVNLTQVTKLGVIRFIKEIAQIAVEELQAKTPVITGNLKESYVIIFGE